MEHRFANPVPLSPADWIFPASEQIYIAGREFSAKMRVSRRNLNVRVTEMDFCDTIRLPLSCLDEAPSRQLRITAQDPVRFRPAGFFHARRSSTVGHSASADGSGLEGSLLPHQREPHSCTRAWVKSSPSQIAVSTNSTANISFPKVVCAQNWRFSRQRDGGRLVPAVYGLRSINPAAPSVRDESRDLKPVPITVRTNEADGLLTAA